jgi:hypothetical protein
MQLLSQTNAASAAQDVLTVRMALLASQTAASQKAANSQGGTSPSVKKSGGISTLKAAIHFPIVVGLLGGSLLAELIG